MKLITVAAIAGVATLGLIEQGSAWRARAAAPTAQELAAQISANDTALRQAIDAWKGGGDPPATQAPDSVMGPAESLQQSVMFLAAHSDLGDETIALLPGSLAGEIRELTAAARKLRKLSKNSKHRKLKTGTPPTLSDLVSHYEEAERLYGIGSEYLAAVHLVETKFSRVKSNSVAGAKGPMQFIPSTWKTYGRGGNIQDPHDSILAAARLLRANGAPGSYARALRHYNDSGLYVDAVIRYAGVIASDPYAIYFLYCWQP